MGVVLSYKSRLPSWENPRGFLLRLKFCLLIRIFYPFANFRSSFNSLWEHISNVYLFFLSLNPLLINLWLLGKREVASIKSKWRFTEKQACHKSKTIYF